MTSKSTIARPSVEWPADAKLGSAMAALEPDRLLSACLEAIPTDGQKGRRDRWQSVQMFEALYHPRRYVRIACALLVDASVPSARFWPQSDVIYLQHPVRCPVSRRAVVLHIGGCAFECYRFPNDRRLRGLRKFTSKHGASDVWQTWVSARGESFDLDPHTLRRSLIRYVPEQKWIAKLRARGTASASGPGDCRSIAVRASSPGTIATLAARHRLLARLARKAALACKPPDVVGTACHDGLLAVKWLRGATFLESMGTETPASVMDRVARAIHSLHNVIVPGLPEVTHVDVVRRIENAVTDLALGSPQLTRQLTRVRDAVIIRLQRFDGLNGCVPATVHNDFHWNQMRFSSGRIALFDLERMGRGDPLIDVANFATQLRMLARRGGTGVDEPTADRWADMFLKSWSATSRRPVNPDPFSAYAVLSVLELARGMMRHLRPGWPDLARRCVEFAESVVGPDGEGPG